MKTFFAFRTTEERCNLVEIALVMFGIGDTLDSEMFDQIMVEIALQNSKFKEVVRHWRNEREIDVKTLKELGLNDKHIKFLTENIYKY